MRLGAVILDFDGTLVESVGIKDRAFRELFEPEYPDRIDEIMAYHLSHNATVRYDKIRYVIERILGETYTPQRASALADRFGSIVEHAIAACPSVAGLDDFLDALQGRIPLYVVSMTPDEELKRILAARGLDKRLTGVYGASWRKVNAIADLLQREGIARGEAVLVGDTEEDRISAENAGVHFIGRNSGKALNGVSVYDDLHGVLQELLARGGSTAEASK